MKKEVLATGSFDFAFIEALHAKLEELDGCKYKIRHLGDEITDTCWFIGPDLGEGCMEFRVSIRVNEIVISEARFAHQRQGIMTSLSAMLLAEAKEIPLEAVRIKCACTEEMVAWCVKNGFTLDERTARTVEGFELGDYVKVA